MINAHTRTTVQQVEAPILANEVPGTLMRHASGLIAGQLTTLLRDRFGGCYGRRVVLLVGPGNNGGDALYAGAMLRRRGAVVSAVLVADHAHPEALQSFQASGGRCIWAAHEAVETVAGPAAGKHRRTATASSDSAVQLPDDTVMDLTGAGQRGPDSAFGVDPHTAATASTVAEFSVDEETPTTAGQSDLLVITDDAQVPAYGTPPNRRPGQRGAKQGGGPAVKTPAITGANSDSEPTGGEQNSAEQPNIFALPTVTATLERADVVLDGMYGLGGKAGLHGVAATVAQKIPASAYVVAVDVPSGLTSDSGTVSAGTTINAAHTLAIGTLKPCHLLPPAKTHCGTVTVLDVGFDFTGHRPAVSVITQADVAAQWPTPTHTTHKYSRGVLGVVAGGDLYPGAATLTVSAALNTGVGLIRYQGSRQATSYVRAACPEVVCGSGQVQAWVLGPGVDAADTQARLAVRQAFTSALPCVIDAGALDLWHSLGANSRPGGPVVMTPHAGELARMLGVSREHVEANQVHCAAQFATQTQATILLKGPLTVIADADGLRYVGEFGTPWLATAGSGDVLAGIIGALLASGVAPTLAAAMGAWVHGAAGKVAAAGGPIRAEDITKALPGVIGTLLTS